VINIHELSPVIHGCHERQIVLFFVRPGQVRDRERMPETEPNKMVVAKQYANEILDLQSTQIFHGLSCIATAKYAINITLRPSLLILQK